MTGAEDQHDLRGPRTTLTRLAELSSTDRGMLDALLDEVMVGHIGLVRPDGFPVVFPTAIARDGDRLLVHGSTGSPWMRVAASGAPVCIEVTAMDALVVARSAFESSIRYRSAVLFGSCVSIEGDSKRAALDVITDRLIPGRVSEVRAPKPKELAATLVLAMPIREWSMKLSDGWPDDPDEDVAGNSWAGVVPIAPTAYGEPLPAPDLRTGIEPPPSVTRLATRRP